MRDRKLPLSELENICGRRAVEAALRARPQEVVGLVYDDSDLYGLEEILKLCASHRIAYKQVDSESLAKMTGGAHHEGVSIRAQKRRYEVLNQDTFFRDSDLVVVMDSVTNPHNMGAIARTCAFFGVEALVIPTTAQSPEHFSISSASQRIAEGAFESIRVLIAPGLAQALERLKVHGFVVASTDVLAADPELRPMDPSSLFSQRVALVMGNEAQGVSQAARQASDLVVHIPKRGSMESLNVSVAAGVLLYAARNGFEGLRIVSTRR